MDPFSSSRLALRRVALVATFVVSGCGGGGGGDAMTGPGPEPPAPPGPSPPAPPSPPGNVLEIRLEAQTLSFVPDEPTIAVGTTIRWVNDSNLFHTITPQGHSEWERQTTSQQGVVFEHTFQNAGSFPYFCEPHQAQGMQGEITVQ